MEIEFQPLRSLFLDLNSYFASVEQQVRPELRGKPIVVAPVEAETTFAIAASYEAKKFGVKTLTRIDQARKLCPELIVVQASSKHYVEFHERIKYAAESVMPIDKVCSIDEMRFELLGREREPEAARKIALRIKQAIYDQVGECMHCSVGIGPNHFLAKIGTELQKPNGLVILTTDTLFDQLRTLKLTEFPGINKRMQARLQAKGIFTTSDMLLLDATQLRAAFGSVEGERWWHLLRGQEVNRVENERKSISHSNVLGPQMRSPQAAREVILRLTQKACARLRKLELNAGRVSIGVKGLVKSDDSMMRISPTSDSLKILDAVAQLWAKLDFEMPIQVGMTLSDLAPPLAHTPSLFEAVEPDGNKFSEAMDLVNQKFGKHAIFPASYAHALGTGTEKIAFQKTDLFSEGKGDNEIEIDTFRGMTTKD